MRVRTRAGLGLGAHLAAQASVLGLLAASLRRVLLALSLLCLLARFRLGKESTRPPPPRCARRPEERLRLPIAATTRQRAAPLRQAMRLLARVNHGGGDRLCLRRCSGGQRRRRRSRCGGLHGGPARTLRPARAALSAARLALGGTPGAASLVRCWRGRLGRCRHHRHRRCVARSVTWWVRGDGACRAPPEAGSRLVWLFLHSPSQELGAFT